MIIQKGIFCVYVFPPVFEMLHAAQTAEPAVDHDGHSGAERLTLLHAAQSNIDTPEAGKSRSVDVRVPAMLIDKDSVLPVRGQNYRASLFDDAQDCVPQGTAGFRVHACCWFVLWIENNVFSAAATTLRRRFVYRFSH